MPSAPAIFKPSPSSGRRSRRRSAGSTAPAIRTATVLSNTPAPTSKAWSIKAGRIPTTRCSTPTAGWRKARSRSPKCKAMSMPPSAWRRIARGGWVIMPLRASSTPKLFVLRRVSKARSGARRSELTRWRSTARKIRAGCAHRMPGKFCSPALPTPTTPPRSPRAFYKPTSFPAGASAPWRAAKPAIIRCRITTARSGRTTTR